MSTSSRPVLQPSPCSETHPFPYIEAQGGADAAEIRCSVRSQARNEEAARDKGRLEGETQARAAYEQQMQALRQTLGNAIAAFAEERAAYFEKVELEVVQLALAIARKVLHREAQVDPLLLAGIVRVALDQLEHGTKAIIKVPPQKVTDWRSYFAGFGDVREVPDLVEDPTLPVDQCVLETGFGTTTLGLEVQLKEVERGLMDLLARRSAAP